MQVEGDSLFVYLLWEEVAQVEGDSLFAYLLWEEVAQVEGHQDRGPRPQAVTRDHQLPPPAVPLGPGASHLHHTALGLACRGFLTHGKLMPCCIPSHLKHSQQIKGLRPDKEPDDLQLHLQDPRLLSRGCSSPDPVACPDHTHAMLSAELCDQW